MRAPHHLTGPELKNWLRDHLQMKGDAVDLRNESPYEGALRLWETGTSEVQSEFIRAVNSLVKEAVAEPWDAVHFHELGTLIEAGRMFEVTSTLEDITHSAGALESAHRAQLHMLAMRTLLGLGWKGTPDYWRSQKLSMGNRWPGLIFHGLARHRLSEAFVELPSLIQDEVGMNQILDLFPGLMRELNVNIDDLQAAARPILSSLPPSASTPLRDWFEEHDRPLPSSDHTGLWEALRLKLDGDIAPRTRHSTLGDFQRAA